MSMDLPQLTYWGLVGNRGKCCLGLRVSRADGDVFCRDYIPYLFKFRGMKTRSLRAPL